MTIEQVKSDLGVALVGLEGARAVLVGLMSSLEAGLLSAVLKQQAAALLEELIDPALGRFRELEKLTEAEAGPAFLRQLGDRLDAMGGASKEVTMLLEAAYGASAGADVAAITKTVRTLNGQMSAITASLQEYERGE